MTRGRTGKPRATKTTKNIEALSSAIAFSSPRLNILYYYTFGWIIKVFTYTLWASILVLKEYFPEKILTLKSNLVCLFFNLKKKNLICEGSSTFLVYIYRLQTLEKQHLCNFWCWTSGVVVIKYMKINIQIKQILVKVYTNIMYIIKFVIQKLGFIS